MALSDFLKRSRRPLDGGSEGGTEEGVSPLSGDLGANDAVRRRQRLLLAGVAARREDGMQKAVARELGFSHGRYSKRTAGGRMKAAAQAQQSMWQQDDDQGQAWDAKVSGWV